MAVYSHSKISTFEKCPLKFKFRYIDKIKPKIERTIETHLGSCVHDALEWLYKNVKSGTVPSLDEVIIKYSSKWEKEFKEEYPIAKEGLTAKDYFNKGVEFIVNYYLENQPFDDNTLEVEKKIILELEEGKYKLQGYIDRLVYNLETEEYEIHDYKTANSLPSKEKINEDRQLALYSLAIKEKYGHDKEVKLVWHFLAYNKKIHIKKDNNQLKKLKEKTIDKIKEIESTKEFPPKKSKLCDWCEYKDICPAWGNSPDKPSKEETQDLDDYPFLKKFVRDNTT